MEVLQFNPYIPFSYFFGPAFNFPAFQSLKLELPGTEERA